MSTQAFSAANFYRAPARSTLRVLVAAFLLSVSQAYADEYSDVTALLRAGKLTEALAKADQYIASKPRDPQMRFIKGVIQHESGKPVDAINTFTQMTQDFPELPEPYNNLAVLHAGQSQFDKARAALEMAIRTNPTYATAHENLGDVYAKLASQAYSKALQLDGGNTGVPPKLALIRTLFAPDAKGQRPSLGAQSAGPLVAAASVGTKPAPAASGTTAPVAPTVTAAVTASSARGINDKDAETAVRNWAAAWSSKDMTGYLASYGKDFDPPGTVSRKTWEEERRSRITGKSRISVKLEDLSVTVDGSKAVVKFKQVYSADKLNVTSRKTLELLRSADKWVIVRESTG